MSLENVLAERPDGFSLTDAYRSDRWWVACRTCRKKHPFVPQSDLHREQQFADFRARHTESRGCYVTLYTPERIEQLARREERRRRARHESVLNYAHNASVLVAFQGSDQSITITALNSLASSATAGWGSGNIDNSSNLYLDYLVAVTFAAVNTAPASDKAFYFFTATALNTSDLPSTGAAAIATTQATLTFPSVSTLACAFPLLKAIPYPVQNVAIQTSLMATAWAFNGLIGLQLWYAVLNFSGMTIAASSNAIKYRGTYLTVA